MAFEKIGDLRNQAIGIQHCRQAQSGECFDSTFIDELRKEAYRPAVFGIELRRAHERRGWQSAKWVAGIEQNSQ
jgi:hypothetical protein